MAWCGVIYYGKTSFLQLVYSEQWSEALRVAMSTDSLT